MYMYSILILVIVHCFQPKIGNFNLAISNKLTILPPLLTYLNTVLPCGGVYKDTSIACSGQVASCLKQSSVLLDSSHTKALTQLHNSTSVLHELFT